MSNPTTPFGWQMPTNTDLVTDLPADFEVFGQAVATSMADLLGGTTGQVLAKNTNADMDFVWTSPNPGDITEVTAGTGISGGGTSGAVTITNSMATAFTTSGDLIQATGSGTFARLATGTAGQYLTTNGTTNSWATVATGGMTLITTTTFNNTVSTYTYSSLGSYKHLMILLENGSHTAAGVDSIMCRFNGDTASNYQWFTFGSNSFAFDATGGGTASAIRLFFGALSQNGQANIRNGSGQAWIYDYNGSQIKNTSGANKSYNQTDARIYSNQGTWDNTAAITSITLFTNLGNNFNSGTLKLYGVS